MRRTALALSPHLDDAVFSCGGTLARLARTGWRVVVATLFTKTVPEPRGFALACQLDKGLGPEVDYMALRRNEDFSAMAALGVEPPVHLPFAEAPHRGYGSAAALFGAVLSDDAIVPDLATALRTVLDDAAPDLVLAPQAVGGHVDHVQAVDAIRQAMPPETPILWWRDFPYLARSANPAEPLRPLFAQLSIETITLTPEDAAAREAACLAYRSQLGFQFGGADGLRAKLAEAGDREEFRRSGTDLLLPPAGEGGAAKP